MRERKMCIRREREMAIRGGERDVHKKETSFIKQPASFLYLSSMLNRPRPAPSLSNFYSILLSINRSKLKGSKTANSKQAIK